MPDTNQSTGQGRRRVGLKSNTTSSRTLFLERRVYQNRRLGDAAKLLPIIGMLLFVMPALLLGTPGAGNETGTTALRLVYFFFVWICLIGTCATIARGLAGADTPYEENRAGDDEGQP